MLLIACAVSASIFSQQPHYLNTDVTLSADTLIGDEESLRNVIDESEKLSQTDRKKSEYLIRKSFNFIHQHEVNDTIVIRAYHLLGKILIDKQENEAGIDTLLRCIELKKKAYGAYDPRLAKTYNYIGIGYFHLNDYKNAERYYNSSGQVLSKNNLFNQYLFDVQLNKGILKAVLGKYDTAYSYFNAAYKTLDSLGSSVDSLLVARFYYNFGVLATFMGKLVEANNHYTVAQEIYQRKFGLDYNSLAGININKGTNAYYNYDYNKAELFYQNALDLYLANQDFKSGIPKSYLNLGSVSFKKGEYNNAVYLLKRGLSFNPDNDLKLSFYQNLAEALKEQGDLIEADSNYHQALNLIKKSEVSPMRSITVFSSYADFLIDAGYLSESKKYYDAAIAQLIDFNQGKTLLYPVLLTRIGDYHRLYQGDLDSALVYYNQAIHKWEAILEMGQDSVKPENFNEIRFMDAFLGKATTLSFQYQKTGNLDDIEQSFEIYKWVLNRIELISHNLDQENHLILIDEARRAYDQVIEVASELFIITNNVQYKEAAFLYAEKSKSAVLRSLVQNINALKTIDVPSGVTKYEQQITSEINGLRKLLAEEKLKNKPLANKISFFNKRLLSLLLERDSVIASFEVAYPKYYSLKYDRSVINTNELKTYLDDNEVVLEYVLTDSALYLFVIGKDVNKLKRIEIDSNFYTALDKMIELKSVDFSTQKMKDLEEFVWISHHLWKCLIEPVNHQLSGKRLIIIPDGKLGYLPFELLLSTNETPAEFNYGRLPFLIKEFPISYTYSASLRFNTYFNNHKEFDRSLIAFAPKYSFSTDQQLTSTSNLPDLPNAVAEVKQIREIIGGKTFVGKSATITNFLKKSSGNQVIHLSMHTLINDSMPMLSELVFYNDQSPNSEYLLHTYEIFGLELNAEMVTLSACNTGTGKLREGEGIMSLARGFIYAGVPAIVLTLWEVQDQSGAIIMTSYYEYIKSGHRKDVAMQKAKLDFLGSANQLKSHPFYWSSYIITGDTKSLTIKHSSINMAVGVLGLILILFIILFLIIKKQRKYLG